MNETNGPSDNAVIDGMAEPIANANGAKGTRTRKIKNTGLASLIEEAEALKAAQRAILSRSHSLVVALKRHRKQSRLVQSSLKALKDLQNIGA